MTTATTKPFSNLQLELLRLYATDVSENDLHEIKRLIAAYFARKVVESADQVWDENGYSDALMDEWLKTDLRKNQSDAGRY